MPAIYLDISTHLRARGQTAAGAVAYTFGAAVRDAHGRLHNYASRHETGDIVATEICTNRATPIAASEQGFADAIEQAERRCDARILRTVTVALPTELTPQLRTRLATDFAWWLAARYDTVVACAVHQPDPDGDVKNHHAHLIMPTRALAPNGRKFGAKLRQLDLATRSGDEIARMRNDFADMTNRLLEFDRVPATRHRDAGRAIDAAVVPKAGAAMVAIARKSARRRGERVRGRPAAELVAAAVAAGDLDGTLALEVAHTYRQASRSPGRRQYEPRARSRRARRVDARQAAKLATEAETSTAPAVAPAESADQGAPAPSPAAPATPTPKTDPGAGIDFSLPRGFTAEAFARAAAEAQAKKAEAQAAAKAEEEQRRAAAQRAPAPSPPATPTPKAEPDPRAGMELVSDGKGGYLPIDAHTHRPIRPPPATTKKKSERDPERGGGR